MEIYSKRIAQLRNEMKKENIDIYIILTSDPHTSEYLPNFWKTRNYIAPFKGSSGSIVITKDLAHLWTDGRYFLEADEVLKGTEISLQKMTANNSILEWLSTLKNDLVIGVDFKTLSINLFNALQKVNKNIVDIDLISRIWLDRPPLPKEKIYEHKKDFVFLNRTKKIELIREKMQLLGASSHIISSLDDICYITNLRGRDIKYNPVFLSFMIINKDSAILFIDKEKLDSTLNLDGIDIKEYSEFEEFVSKINTEKVLIDPAKTASFIPKILNTEIIYNTNPSTMLKAIKNDFEIKHIKEAMEADGVALVKFLMWIELTQAKTSKIEDISEVDIIKKLQDFRRENPLYVDDSFSTIAGFNGNGAIVHYKPIKSNCSKLGSGLLLLDSGGQYQNGTTDITRVIPLRLEKEEKTLQKRDYTLVLKSHIAMASAKFPKNIPLPYLDSIARVVLWKEGLDYSHGTGHGVGYFLNVHEGPQVLSVNSPSTQAIENGMIISIEPGIYRENKWGIRLENLVLCREAKYIDCNFLEFETLSLCPFELDLIDINLLNKDEIKWINQYHKMVFDRLKNKLNKESKDWLKLKTREI